MGGRRGFLGAILGLLALPFLGRKVNADSTSGAWRQVKAMTPFNYVDVDGRTHASYSSDFEADCHSSPLPEISLPLLPKGWERQRICWTISRIYKEGAPVGYRLWLRIEDRERRQPLSFQEMYAKCVARESERSKEVEEG